MREIKFRHYNMQEKQYKPMPLTTTEYMSMLDNDIIEEYTGMHDAIGQEIYEGDILLDQTEGTLVGTVVYNTGMLVVDDKPLWQACVDLSSIVVGNVNEGHIYER